MATSNLENSGASSSGVSVPEYTLRTYFQPGFPILACLYAFYRDEEFSLNETATWQHEADNGRDYRGYLEPYLMGERAFPEQAEKLIAEVVPRSSIRVGLSYIPEPPMGKEMVPLLAAELVGAPALPGKQRIASDRVAVAGRPTMPPAKPDERRPPGLLDAERPLLSTLAVMFLNGDKSESVWKTYEFDQPVTDVLRRLAAEDKLTVEEVVLGLEKQLVREFCAQPACW